MFSFTILPDIMTETRDATLSSPLIHPRTVIQAFKMAKLALWPFGAEIVNL